MSVRRSLGWTYIAQALCFAITFGSTIVIARLLDPRDFGIFAMANAVTTLIGVLMQFGLAKYIMRETDVSRDLLRTVFTVNLFMTLLYVGAILTGSMAAGRIFGSPEVGRFLLVFALYPLFAMFEFVPAALCARDMRFGPIAILTVIRAVIMAATTIILALQGFSYMSFAWAQVLSWAATSVGYNLIVWRPDIWRPRIGGIRSVLHFGTQMIGISGVSQISTRASEMVLGSLLGLSNLGLYSRASSLPAQLHANIYVAGSNVIFSRLSQGFRETGTFYETYITFMRLILGLLWPMMFGLAVIAAPVIHILYGSKWQGAATPLALLSIAAAITVAIGMTNEVFILRRETPRQVKIEGIRAVAGFLLFTGGATVSLTLAAAAKIAEAVVALLLYRRPMLRLIGAPLAELRAVYREGLVLTAAAILPALLLMAWSDWSPTTPAPLVVIAVGLGALLWLLLLFGMRHPLALEAARLVRWPRQYDGAAKGDT